MKILLGLAGLGLGILYYRYDPGQHAFFPPCPFRWLTGLPCPGCGSQRCLHHLLHGHWQEAFALNSLLTILLPYLVVGLVVDNSTALREKYASFRQRFYGLTATRFFIGLILLWWVWRLWQVLNV